MFSQDYSGNSPPRTRFRRQISNFFATEAASRGEAKAKFSEEPPSAPLKAGDDKIETKTNKLVSRQSVSSEHSGDELFCLDDPNEEKDLVRSVWVLETRAW